MKGRTRRVRQKQREESYPQAQIEIDAGRVVDLVATAAVSSLVTIAVNRKFKDG